MEEMNNKHEDLVPEQNEEETNGIGNMSDSEAENAAGSSEEQQEQKREKHQKSKHRKEDRAEELEQAVAQCNDKYLRLYSEFDNYRKRSLKERTELSKSASSELVTTLLPVLDDFERALGSMEAAEDKENAIIDGINLIYNKLKSILSQQGLERMTALGEEFNTDFHEALTSIPAPTPEQKGRVMEVIQNGYLVNGKVIRFAKVVVGA